MSEAHLQGKSPPPTPVGSQTGKLPWRAEGLPIKKKIITEKNVGRILAIQGANQAPNQSWSDSLACTPKTAANRSRGFTRRT